MASSFDAFTASVDLSKVESWEKEELMKFLRDPTIEDNHFVVFECKDYEDRVFGHGWDESSLLLKEGDAEDLDDLIAHLIERKALSLTYKYTWCTSGWDEVEELPDFEESAERLPTLVLQEVLAKRLEESVSRNGGG
jgi:hypothetical protein